MSRQDSADDDRNVVARLKRRARRGTPPKPPDPWGEKHRREAWARVFELTARSLLMGTDPLRPSLPLDPAMVATEEDYAITLRKFSARFGVKVNSEVRRVRDLAEGRKARETVRRSYVSQPGTLDEDFGTPGGASLAASQRRGARAVTATVRRIRKVTP